MSMASTKSVSNKTPAATNPSSTPGSPDTDEKAGLLDFMSPAPGTNKHLTMAGSRTNDCSFKSAVHIVRCERADALDATRPTSRADALTLCVDLRGTVAHAASSDECSFIAPPRQPGELTIYDRRHRWRLDLPHSADCILYHIPRDIFDHMAANVALAWSETVPGLFQGGRADEALGYLAQATWSSFDSTKGVSALFVDHLAASATLHVIKSYGVTKPVGNVQGGLGPWREAQIRDLVGLQLHEPLSLATLAKACKLSTSHFTREFKNSFGCSPHQWLRLQRLERAKHLIRTTSDTLSEIAVASGFADQSHMTRIFSRQERVSPAAWRRRSGHQGIVSKDNAQPERRTRELLAAYGR